jgi:hypothetical protein
MSRRIPLRARRILASACNNMVESLERRQLLAAHIQGDPTVYSTIQSAVDAANAGSIINVDAGTYSEWVVVNKSLTLRGAQAGVDARSNTRDGVTGETIMNGIVLSGGRSASLSINADNVTIDGFTIQGNTSPDLAQGAGMVIGPSRSGSHIYNSIFQNNVTGIFLANSSATNPAIIYHNVFRNNNNAGNEGGRAIYTNGEISGGLLTNVQIDSNFFYNNRGSSGTTGLEAALALEAQTAGKQTNISVTNNAFDNNGKAVLFFNTVGINITGNVITQTLDKYSGTLRFEGNNQNVNIQNNTLYDNTGPAVAVDSKGVSGFNSGFVINNNNIYGNSTGWSGSKLGVITDSTAYDGVPDDRFNYWGAANGPGGDGTGSGDWVYGIGHVVSGNQWVWTAGGNELWSPFASAPIGSLRSPYLGLPQSTDATVQTENYDAGGEGNGYHDLDASNSGGQYRTGQGVDLQTTTDTGGGYNLTNTKAGEWVGYTVNVPVGGTFTINFRVANAQTTGGKFHLTIDGVDVTGQLQVPNTGNNQTWTTLAKTAVAIAAGVHDVRLVFDTNGSSGTVGNFNWIGFSNTAPTGAPAAPSNLAGNAITPARVDLTWIDNSNNETGFIIERKTGINGAWSPVTTTLGNVTSYIDTTVSPGTLYVYRVRATNVSGDSQNSNEETVTTPQLLPVTYLSDLPFAGTPTNGWGPVERDQNVGGSNTGDGTTIVLNGVSYAKGLGTNSVSDITFNLDKLYKTFLSDVGVDDRQTFAGTVQFTVYADNVLVFDSHVMDWSSPTQSVALDVTNVQQLRLHVDNGGDDSDYDWADWAGARLTTGTATLNPPTDLNAQVLSATQVKLTWTDTSVGESGFKIERSTDGVNFTPVGTAGADATSFIDSTAQPGKSYTYQVRSTSGSTDSAPSLPATANTPSVPALTYVSDMQWVSSTNGWGPVERDMNVGGQAAGDGTALKLAGVTYTKGLGTNSPSEVVLNLQGSYGWFLANVGVDDKQTSFGTVKFQVWTGTTLAFDSGVMTATSATQNVTVDLTNVQQLRLVVTDGGDDNAFDWADWANARLLAPGPLPSAPTAPTTLSAAVNGNAINLNWTDTSSNEDNFLIERSSNGGSSFTQIGTVLANVNTYTDLTPTTGIAYVYRVRAANSVGNSGYSNNSAPVTVNPLPAAWTQADVGSVGTAVGSAAFDGTTYTVRGGGSSSGAFTAKSDVFHYVYQSKSGNFSITSKVATLQNTNSAAKAGIMVRNGTAANAVFVGLFVTPTGGLKFVRRTSAGGGVTTTTVSGITAPVYLRLVRSSNTFSAQRSSDGVTWITIGSASVTMPSTVTTGLVVSSGAANTLNTSTFSNVSIV